MAGAGGLQRYRQQPYLDDDGWLDGAMRRASSGDAGVLAPVAAPFSADGGLKLLTGNLGRAVIKTSAVKPEHRVVQAPAIVFDTQEDVMAAFERGELQRDFVAVVRFQGPRANGMPELHKLTPLLGVLQDQGFHVALVTDGRMSGASGKVPAAIHVTPECLAGGALARVRGGDMLVLDAESGVLRSARRCRAEWQARQAAHCRPRRVPPRHGPRAVRRVPRQCARRRGGRGDLLRGRAAGQAHASRRLRRCTTTSSFDEGATS